MVYCDVTSKFIDMDKRTKDKIAAINAEAKAQEEAAVDHLYGDVEKIVRNWSEDEIKAWLERARTDDSVSYAIYKMVYGVWSNCHLGTKMAALFVIQCVLPEEITVL